MRYIKMFLTGLTGLSLLATLMGLMMPSSVKITRGVIVNADSTSVDHILLNIDHWNQWMPWIEPSGDLIVQQLGERGQAGSALKWKSLDGQREGVIAFKGREPGTLLLSYDFKGMNKSEGGFRIRNLSEGRTELQWYMEYPLKWYPWERFYGIFLDSMIGSVLESGLQKLVKYIGDSDKLNA
jgi:hypothetical protein